MSARRAAEFDPASMRVSQSGLASYYWPVRQDEPWTAGAAIIQTFRSVLSEPLRQRNEDARYAFAVSAPIFMEVLGMFAARLLATRCATDNVLPHLPEEAPLWQAAFNGGPSPEPRPLRLLRAGVSRPDAWRRFVRPLADITRPNFFRRRPIELINMGRDIVIVTPCPLSRKHAAKRNVRPVYTPLSEWFYPPTAEELRLDPLKPMSADLRDELVSALEAVFTALGAKKSRLDAAALPRLLDEATAWARFYLRRVERNPKRIPMRLWKGSSGVMWSRFLADAVQAGGGEVTGHDHAYGANYSDHTLIPFTELQANNIFVTYTRAHAELYERLAPTLQIGTVAPTIQSLDDPEQKTRSPVRTDAKSPRTVLYVPAYLSNGRVIAMPFMPPVMAFDWQARLFKILKDMRMSVTQKPHPDSPVSPLPAFERNFGIRTNYMPFEQVMNNYDVLLFDYPTQSCFGWALRSGKPMVLVDFGVASYKPELKELLDRRCAIVPGYFDADNRAQVDAVALKNAIARAPNLTDMRFADAVIAM